MEHLEFKLQQDLLVTDVISKYVKKRKRRPTELNPIHEYSNRDAHSHEADQNADPKDDNNPDQLSTKTFETNAFGKLYFKEGTKKTHHKGKQYVFLDYKTDVKKILNFLRNTWKLDYPNVVLLVLSDSDSSTANKIEAPETKLSAQIEYTRKTICSDIVEAATSTDAWIITGGFNNGTDKFLGDEVMQRLAYDYNTPLAIIGISKWGCLAKKDELLDKSCDPNGHVSESECVSTGLSLNQHHTHFLFVDDGNQTLDSANKLLENIEHALMNGSTQYHVEEKLGTPVVYILIGGGIKSFELVERALKRRIPVIVAEGTGGAADVISEELASRGYPTLEYLPEITEKLFRVTKDLPNAKQLQKIIAKIKTEINLSLLFEIWNLLIDKPSSKKHEKFEVKPTKMGKQENTTNKCLHDIKADLNDKSGSSFKVDGIPAVIERMLSAYGIEKRDAKNIVGNNLEKTYVVVEGVLANLKNILNYDLLMKFSIARKENRPITSFILDALLRVDFDKKYDIYTLAADWDNETLFRRLLRDNWMLDMHKGVFTKLLKKDTTKYLQLMVVQNMNSSWLTSSDGLLEKDFKKNALFEKLLKKIEDPKNSSICYRLKGKLLFLWCVQKGMPEAAMFFWKQGQDCLAMAAIAFEEYKKQEKTLEKKKGSVQTNKQMEFFSKLALDFVRTCYQCHQIHTIQLLFEKVEDLENRCPIEIADDTDFKELFYLDVIQYLLNTIWSGDIENCSTYKYVPMILSAACPLLAPALLTISPANHDGKKEANKPVCHYFSRVGRFLKAPLVTFSYWFISYIAYLTLFSIVMLTNFRPKMGSSEICLTIWTFILAIEEVKQVKYDIEYKRNKWNYLDIGALILYVIGFILRMIYLGHPAICPDCLYVARIVLAFSLMISFMRALQYLSIYDTLGPKIYMMQKLLADLFGFLLILAVFISAYGVVSNVILYPNQTLNATLLHDVFYDSWWTVLQQFNREDTLKGSCNDRSSVEMCSTENISSENYFACKEKRCSTNVLIVSVILAFYALITCIMMLNVLIAMFNKTFTDIDNDHAKVAKKLQCRLLSEYQNDLRTVPPPLCVITYLYIIFNKCKSYLKDDRVSRSGSHNTDFPLTNNMVVEDGENCEDDGENCEDDEENCEDDGENCEETEGGEKTKRLKEWEHKVVKTKRLKEWEHKVVVEYCKEIKDKEGWSVDRTKSETACNCDEEAMVRNIIREIRNQMSEERLSEERPTEERPTEERPTEERPTEERPTEERPTEERPTEERPTEERPTEEMPTRDIAGYEETRYTSYTRTHVSEYHCQHTTA